MAGSDDRAPPDAGDTRENPTGDGPELDPAGGEAGRRPPARRPTGGIPVQRRKSTSGIPVVGGEASGQALPQARPVSRSGAIPRRPSSSSVPTADPEPTAPQALPVERPVSRSGAIPRRPSSSVPLPRRPSSQAIPAQGGPPARRPSQAELPLPAQVEPRKPGLLNEDTSPKIGVTDTQPGPSETSADRPAIRLSTEVEQRPLDEPTDPQGARAPAVHAATELRPPIDLERRAEPTDESTDPESRRPAASATEVRPSLEVEPEPTGLSAVPTPRPRAAATDLPWEEVKDEPTNIGALPSPRPSLSDEPTGTQPLTRLDRPAPLPDLSDPEDDALPTHVLARPDAAALAGGPAPTEPPLSDQPVRRGGTYSRQRDGAAQKPKASSPLAELSRVIRLEAVRNATHGTHGFQVAIGLVMLVLGAGGFLAFWLRHGERPPLETLQVQYPYGFSGGQLPNGRPAPPVAQVEFDYQATVDCGEDVCVRYLAHSADNTFRLTMDLRKDGSDWKLVSGGGPPPGQGMNP